LSNGNRRIMRLAATGILAAGSLTLLSAPAFAARDTADACPPGAAAEDNFTDTGAEGSPIEGAVDCLVAYGVSSGTSATTYGPSGNVSRAQMATFIMQKLDLVEGFERPADAPAAFTDVDETNDHFDNINDAAALDIVNGFESDTNDDGETPDYQPSGLVTRGQMATFIVNQMRAAGAEIPAVPADTEFTDIDGHTHEDNIKILEALDIVDGLEGDNNGDGETPDYGPDNPVSRGQMAFFLTRDIDVLVEAGLIDPLTGGNNQDFTVTPGDNITELVTDDRADSAVVLTVDVGDAESVDLALFECDSVQRDGGTVTFNDSDDDNEADDIGDGDAAIEVVQGVGQADDTTEVDDVEPDADGEIAVSVNANVAGDAACVVLVAFEDDGDDDLDLAVEDEDASAPIEPFGVSGELTFLPEEGANGTNDSGTVTFVDKDTNTFVIDDITSYVYDPNDNFTVIDDDSFGITGFGTVPLGTGNQVPSDESEFEAALSVGDEVDVTLYSQNDALSSTFDIVDNTPDPPVVDITQDGNDIEFDVEPSTPGYADMDADDTLIIARAEIDEDTGGDEDECDAPDVDPDDLSEDDFTPVGSTTVAAERADDDNGTFEVDLVDQPAGCYLYIATFIVDGDIGDPGTEAGNAPIEIEGGDDTNAPTIDDARIDEAGALTTVIDATDVIQLVFDEDIETADITTARIIATDADGDRFQISCATNTCELLDGEDDDEVNTNVLEITITAGATDLNAGTGDDVANQPATVVLTAELEDAAGNAVDLAASDDVIIDDEGDLNDTFLDGP
jgi:hypothetical protein